MADPSPDLRTLSVTTDAPPTPDSQQHPGLIVLIALLAGFLLFLIVMLLFPAGCQNRLCRLLRGDTENFNYIDVGLYKTRHSMYRKEIYLQQMRRSLVTNTTHSSVSSPPSGRESDAGTSGSSASTERSGVLQPLLEDHLTTIDELADERVVSSPSRMDTSSGSNATVILANGRHDSSTSVLQASEHQVSCQLASRPMRSLIPTEDEEVCMGECRPGLMTISKSDSALRDCCEHCTPRIIVNKVGDAEPRKSVMFVTDQELFTDNEDLFHSFV